MSNSQTNSTNKFGVSERRESDVSIVDVDNVTKSFGLTQALKGVTFQINGSGVTGIIGPNGAGKTTLLRILSCQSKPDTGTASILGYSVADESYSIKKRLTLLPQGIKGHYYTFTPKEYIYHYHRIHGRSRQGARNVTENALDEFGIDFRDKKIDELSGGMVKRTMLAMTLSTDTPVYLLDEPTTGLDPAAKQALWHRIREMGTESHILMTSHHTDEIADVCDQVLLFNDGEIVTHADTGKVAEKFLPGYGQKIVVETGDESVELAAETITRGRFCHVYPTDKNEFEATRQQLVEMEQPHKVTDVAVEDLFLTGWNDGIR